jgi:hypothetical protein
MAKSATDITSITTQLFKLLQPLGGDERQRAIKATLTLLGEEGTMELDKPKKRDEEESAMDSSLPAKARTWMRTNTITQEQISQVFHVENGTVEIIAAEAPGKNGKEKTINAYVLTGIAALLQTGEAKFEDKAGRASCDQFGCYQGTNHATILKNKGNLLSGSKDGGWSLTGPGLKAGAELVKKLTGAVE